MTNTMAIRSAALSGFLAVALGAFGAHGLKEILTRHGTAGIWETAVFYHFIHTMMLYWMAQRRPVPTGPWLSFFTGIVIFSGSLYLLAVIPPGGMRWLGAMTPIGGVSFLVGWLWLAFTATATAGESSSPAGSPVTKSFNK